MYTSVYSKLEVAESVTELYAVTRIESCSLFLFIFTKWAHKEIIMYQAFYGLNEAPFTIAPNPKYLFLSQQHQQAVNHLQYCLKEGGGFILLTGEVGTGKTTLARSLLSQLDETTNIASILNPSLSEIELLATLCDELKISYADEPTLKQLTDLLSQFLLDNHQQGRNTLLIIDEAQHLRSEVLEQLRLLTNLETNEKKLLQVMLIGQPELQQQLKQNHLRQLAQRITARYHLMPLGSVDVSAYVAHRLSIAGRDSSLFTKAACNRIHQLSGGIARIINLICDKALLHAYGSQLTEIGPKTINEVAKDILAIEQPVAQNVERVWVMPVLASFVTLMFGYSATTMVLTNNNKLAVHDNKPALIAPVNNNSFNNELTKLLIKADSQSRAFSALMNVWGTSHGAGSNGCNQAKTYGLRCFSGTGWQSLVEYNHPALIGLQDSGNIYYAVIINTNDENAIRIQLGTSQVNVTKAWLLERFTGSFTLLWQPNFDYQKALSIRDQGDGVNQLTQWLNKLYAPGQYAGDYFDESLRDNVKRFQQENQLTVDGIAGEKTLLKLQSVTGSHTKKLRGTQ